MPAGATETGTWSGIIPAGVEKEFVPGEPVVVPGEDLLPISLNTPLASSPEPVFVKAPGEEVAKCPGVVDGVPTAEPGKLCVYATAITGTFLTFIDPTSGSQGAAAPTGVGTYITCPLTSSCLAMGTFAVKAP